MHCEVFGIRYACRVESEVVILSLTHALNSSLSNQRPLYFLTFMQLRKYGVPEGVTEVYDYQRSFADRAKEMANSEAAVTATEVDDHWKSAVDIHKIKASTSEEQDGVCHVSISSASSKKKAADDEFDDLFDGPCASTAAKKGAFQGAGAGSSGAPRSGGGGCRRSSRNSTLHSSVVCFTCCFGAQEETEREESEKHKQRHRQRHDTDRQTDRQRRRRRQRRERDGPRRSCQRDVATLRKIMRL